MARKPRSTAEQRHAAAWATFYHGPGRAALAALFDEFGLYAAPQGDATGLARAWGQRDVLVRLIELINLKTEDAVRANADDEDILDRIMTTTRSLER